MDQEAIRKLARRILEYSLDRDSADGAENFGEWLSEALPGSAREIQKDLSKDIASGEAIDERHIRFSSRAIALQQRGKNVRRTLETIAARGAAQPLPQLERATLLIGHRILHEHLAHAREDKKGSDDITSGQADLSEYEGDMDWSSGISQADRIREHAEKRGKEAADEISSFAGALGLYGRLLQALDIPVPQRGRG